MFYNAIHCHPYEFRVNAGTQICSAIKSVSTFSNEKTIYAKKVTFYPFLLFQSPFSYFFSFSHSSFVSLHPLCRQIGVGECNWRQMQFPILDSPFALYSNPMPFLLVFLLYWIPFTEFSRWIIGRCFLHDFARTINETNLLIPNHV